MLKNILEIVVYELQASIATRRALMVIALYLGSGIIGSLIYVGSLRAIEERAVHGLIQQGVSPEEAATALTVIQDKAYEDIVSFFVGAPKEDLNPTLIESALLPVFLWASLVFLPLLILLTSFDHMVSDLHSRSVCYQMLRVSRRELLAGKTISQMILFSTVTLLNAACLLGMGLIMLDSVSIAETVPGLLLSWLLLIPVGFCYVGITTFSSSSAKQPFGALVMTVFILFALRLMGAAHHWESIDFLQHLSPSHYETGLWLAHVTGPIGSIAAYTAFGSFFLFMADRKLAGRDL